MNTELKDDGERPTFCLVHGRYHDGWCWHLVKEELAEQGWKSIEPDLPIENYLNNLDDHARVVTAAEQASGAKSIIRVGWSWGANVIPRNTDSGNIDKLIFVAGAFHPATLEQWKHELIYVAHGLGYQAMQNMLDVHSHQELKQVVVPVLYNGVRNPALVDEALEHLGPHSRREVEPALPVFPSIPREYILTTNDRALKPDYQRSVAKLLDIKPTAIESGHTPMLAKPKELATLLIKLANQTAVN